MAQVVTTTLTFVMITFTVAVVLLARGPLSLGFLSPYVAAALNDEDAPIQIAFADTVLTWERKRRRLDIRIVDVSVTGADGEQLAAMPQVGLKLRGLGLLEFQIELERLVLIEPKIKLVRKKDGRIELGLGGEEGQRDLVETWLEGDWPGFVRSLTQISIIDADLSFDDRLTGKLWRAPTSGLSLTRGAAGIVVELVAKMVIADRPAQVAVDALYRGRDAPIGIAVNFSNIEPAILALETGIDALEPLRAFRMAVSGHLSMTLDVARELQDARFDLSSGAGVLSLPDIYRTPLAIAAMKASGKIVGDQRMLHLDKLEADLGDGVMATFAGTVQVTDAGPGIKGKGEIVNTGTAALARYWPEGLQDRARRWVVRNIQDGACAKARLDVDIRPGELEAERLRDDAVVLEFDCRNVKARYWDALPALTHARGHGRINAKEVHISVGEARLGDLAIGEGLITIDLRRTKAQFAEITFLASGPTRAILSLLDREPLGLARRLGFDTGAMAGEASVRTRLRVPLEGDRRLEGIGYAAAASLEGFALDGAFGAYRLSRGALQLTVAPDGIGAVGTIALNGVPASITWRHDFAAESTHPSRYGMAAVLGEAEREALGIQLAPYLEGAVKVELQLAKDRSGGFDVKGTADLAGARLGLSEVGWEKPFGQQGAAEFAFRARQGDPLEVDRFRIATSGFEAVGRASHGEGGTRIAFERLRFAGHDFGADVSLPREGETTIELTGAALDLRSILDREDTGAAKGGGSALRLSVALDSLILSDAFWLKGARATAARRDGRWREISATGGLNGGAPVEIQLSPDGERYQKLVIRSRDAGGVVAATGYLEGVQGGQLTLVARLPRDDDGREPTIGRLSIEDFVFLGAPKMTSMLRSRTLSGGDDADKGEATTFKRFLAPFTIRGDRIEVTDARAVGSSIGLTIAGTIDRGRQTVDLSGNIVPAYALNTALGRIPLVGGLLVGRQGEGVFALGYRVRGPLGDPVVTVNPLTALAPGVLRRLIEAFGKPGGDVPPSSTKEQSPGTAQDP